MVRGQWETLREASFRNVPFFLVEDEGTSGRRAIPRAFPKKETGWTEDNGAVLTQQQINAKLLGQNFQAQLTALLNALNTPGPGELVHPWFGIQRVQVGKVTHRLSTEEGGIAYVSFEVFEAGQRLFPAPAEDTSQKVLTTAQTVRDALARGDYFAALDGLGEMTDVALGDMEKLVTGLPVLPEAFMDWIDRAGRFKDLAGVIIARPGELINQMADLLSDMRTVVTEPVWALRVYEQLRGQWSGDRAELSARKTLPKDMHVVVSSVSAGVTGMAGSVPVTVIPPTPELQNNILHYRQLMIVLALVAQSETLATMTFTSGSEATLAGERLAQVLAEQAAVAVEEGKREMWRALRDLRFAVVNDMHVRGAQLPDVRRLSPLVTTTATLLAWRETGNTENRDAIVSRNRLRDPGFILPSQTIEIID